MCSTRRHYEAFLVSRRVVNCSRHTIGVYATNLGRFARTAGAELAACTSLDVQRCRNLLTEGGRKPKREPKMEIPDSSSGPSRTPMKSRSPTSGLHSSGPHSNRDVQQLEWLVAHQVKKMSVPVLAQALGGDPEASKNTIWRALKRLSGWLPLSLRAPGARGRKTTRAAR
jgi:hypothetical protein